jgi:hypothetical protein
MPWTKAIFTVVVLCIGFQYGLLFSKFSRGIWAGIDTVTLIAISVTLVAAAYVIILKKES